jgi:hypothetical protein
LDAVKESAKVMQAELMNLVKSEFSKKISTVEQEVKKVENRKNESMKKFQGDSQ